MQFKIHFFYLITQPEWFEKVEYLKNAKTKTYHVHMLQASQGASVTAT